MRGPPCPRGKGASPRPPVLAMANPANPTRAVRRDTLRRGDRGGRGVAGSLSNAGVSADKGGDSTESDSVVGASDDTTGAVRRAAGGTGEAGVAGVAGAPS